MIILICYFGGFGEFLLSSRDLEIFSFKLPLIPSNVRHQLQRLRRPIRLPQVHFVLLPRPVRKALLRGPREQQILQEPTFHRQMLHPRSQERSQLQGNPKHHHGRAQIRGLLSLQASLEILKPSRAGLPRHFLGHDRRPNASPLDGNRHLLRLQNAESQKGSAQRYDPVPPDY